MGLFGDGVQILDKLEGKRFFFEKKLLEDTCV